MRRVDIPTMGSLVPEAVTGEHGYDRDRRPTAGPGHRWVWGKHGTECCHCRIRRHWPGAADACPMRNMADTAQSDKRKASRAEAIKRAPEHLPWSREAARELYASGLHLRDVAVILRVSKGRVSKACQDILRRSSRAANGPPRPYESLITAAGKTQSVSAWARELGMDPSSIRDRLNRGWPEQDAVTAPKGSKRPARQTPEAKSEDEEAA